MVRRARSFRRLVLALVFAASIGRAGSALQEDEIRAWPDFLRHGNRYLDSSFDSLPDLDGDGFRDFLLGDPDGVLPGSSNAGSLYILSSAEVPPGGFPPVLRVQHGAAPGARFGQYATSLGDGNGDGVEDHACRAADAWFVLDGRDGKILLRREPSANDINYGRFFRLGDIDRDGAMDFLNGLQAYSGRSLTVLYEIPGFLEELFTRVFLLGDVDCDGTNDYVASMRSSKCDYSRGEVRSGASGDRLYFLSEDYGAYYSECVPTATDVGDVDGDGCADIASGSPPQILRGRTGEVLTRLQVDEEDIDVRLFANAHTPGDLDGNAVPDILAWSSESVPGGDGSQVVRELRAFDGGTHELLWRTDEAWSLLQAGLDWNGDGFPDLLVREAGEIALYSGAPARAADERVRRAGVRVVGSPCASRPGLRIGASGNAFLGRELPIHLSGAAPDMPAFLRVGALTEAARCLRVRPEAVFATRTEKVFPGVGVATVELLLPLDLRLVGARFGAQWVVASSRGFESSAALEIQLGIGPTHPTICIGSVALVDGTPVAGAEVEIVGLGRVTRSGADGRFRLEDVASQRRGVHAIASAELGGAPLFGHLPPVQPIPAGLTDLGTIVIAADRRTLVFGNDVYPEMLEPRLEALGYAVVSQRHLPLALQHYEAIWQVGTGPLDADARSRLVAFVEGGGGLYVSAALVPRAGAEESVQELIDSLVPGTGVDVMAGYTFASFRFSSNAPDQISVLPYDLLSTSFQNGFAPLLGVPAGNVLAASDLDETALGIWAGADLGMGRGRLVVSGTRSVSGDEKMLANLQSFLAARAPSDVLGTVRLPNGSPVSNATIQLLRHGLETRSGPDGGFSFPGVSSRFGPIEAGAWAVVGSTRYQGLSMFDPAEDGQTSVEIVLDPRPLVLEFGRHWREDVPAILANGLVAGGVAAERLRVHLELPAAFDAFTVLWHIGAADFAPAQRAALAAFVRAGGAFQLSGELANTPLYGEPLELLLQDLGLGGIEFGDAMIDAGTAFVPTALDDLARQPNELGSWLPVGPISILQLPPRNLLARRRSHSVAAAFDEVDMATGRGRLVLLTDSDWLFRSEPEPVIANIQRFLERAR